MNKKIMIVISLSAIIIASSTFAIMSINDGKSCRKSKDVVFDLMGWGNIDLSINPDIYTAPFFGVKILSDVGEGTGAISTADFDSNGWIDIVTSYFYWSGDYHSGVTIFYGKGESCFERKNITPNLRLTIYDIDTGDFDGDGDKDILVTRFVGWDENGSWWEAAEIIWNKNGDFNYFDRTIIFHLGASGIPEFGIASSGEVDWAASHIAVADFNQDGYDDFVLGTNCAKVALFLNRGNGSFSFGGIIYDYGSFCKGLATADFNHDEYPDLVVCAENDGTGPINASGYIYLKLNNRSPECFDRTSPGILVTTLPPREETNHTIGSPSTGTVEVLDYNNDGLLDVIFGGSWWIHMFIQQENYTFKPFVVAQLRSRYLTWADHLLDGGFAVADFNKDGWDDFVQGGTEGVIRLFINNKTFACIKKPADRTAYVFGKEATGIINLLKKFPGDKLVIGPIDVTVECLCPMSKVEFYVNDKLVYTDDQPPFTWKWSKPGFGKYLLYVKAYDEKGEFAGRDNVVLWKIL